MVDLVVLGSSSTFPFPRTVKNGMENYTDIENYMNKFFLHDDIICNLAKKGGKEKRTRASLAIVTEKGTVLINSGPDVIYQMEKYKVSPDVVLINHDHSDANGGTKFLGEKVKVLRESNGGLVMGKKIEIFGLEVIPFRVNHASNVKTCGFKIEADGVKFAYFSDLSNTDGIKKWIEDCDFIFADGSNLDQNLPTHLSIISQLVAYKKWGIKKVWFTHIGHKTLPHEELINYCRSIYEPTDIVYDGQNFKI